MEIDINQKIISLVAEYRIFVNEDEQFSATKKFFTYLDEIELFDATGKRPRYTIKQKWTWFKTSYDLTRHDNITLQFRTVKYWRRHYQCILGTDSYDIYGHNGRKYSIYKNNSQIAWWDKESVAWFNGDNYKLVANNNVDIELLICFCLIMDNKTSQNNKGNTVTIDFGHIGPQAKKFDSNWKAI
jgi:uncharacterized protein YxjI